MPDLVHIGFPKTGTTFLQRRFFTKLTSRALVTISGFVPGHDAVRPLMYKLGHSDDANYSEHSVSSYLADAKRRAGGDLLLSDETLSGAVFARGYNWERNAERVHRLLPDAVVLVVVRHQATMLRSLYSLYVQKGGYARFSDFVDNRAEGCDFDPDYLCYDRVIEHYRMLFGVDRVKVLPYELLASEPATFFSELGSVLGSDIAPNVTEPLQVSDNRSLSRVPRWLLRHSNRLFASTRFNRRPAILSIPGACPRLRRSLRRLDTRWFPNASRELGRTQNQVLQAMLPRFEASNARLEELTGLSLGRWAYPGAAQLCSADDKPRGPHSTVVAPRLASADSWD